MAQVQVLASSVCLFQLQAGHDNTAIGCLLQARAFAFRAFRCSSAFFCAVYVLSKFRRKQSRVCACVPLKA